ncbi:MAG: L,D-transpeptidase family protein [Verrucomicrobiae bacterium]|nr:L,D-transpeptidase family protein [Verrucomicrobiae bacterium]
MLRFLVPALAIVFVVTSGASAQDARAQVRPPAAVAAAIKAQVANEPAAIRGWYAERNYQPAWDGVMLSALAKFIANLDRHGLRPELFNLSRWQQTWQGLPPTDADAAKLDIGTTHLALYAIQSLAYGFIDPASVHEKWKPISRTVSPVALLDEALRQGPGEFARWLEGAAAPPDVRYRDLVSTLARYREIAGLGGWKPLPSPTRNVGPGDPYPEVGLLRARLRAEGDLPADARKIRSKTIDAETADALKSFQFRHGIAPDAVMGPATMMELNHPVSHRVDTLIINLDRLRWMPRAYEQAEHLEVNIAEGALRLFTAGRSVDTVKVIVGVKGKHQTPVFHGDMRYLIFRPYWNVPISIAKKEVVPEALADPSYVSRNNYEVVRDFGAGPNDILPATPENLQKVASGALSIRQGTGPGNALGLVKFIFPNDNSVYLHDTPDHSLFNATDRDFSHGCVRVSEPAMLASFVLRENDGWNINQIQAAMQDATRPNNKVNLVSPIPVYLIYWTSTIMDDGRVRFDQDIYGHDGEMFAKFGLGGQAVRTPGL